MNMFQKLLTFAGFALAVCGIGVRFATDDPTLSLLVLVCGAALVVSSIALGDWIQYRENKAALAKINENIERHTQE